jgi:pimeloyl-ACP methyl ester carboxylesterase
MSYTYRELEEDAHFSQAAQLSEVFWMKRGQNCQVPIVWLHASSDNLLSGAVPLVLLHCHANATDIGVMMGAYLELSRILGLDVVGFEYSGYGASIGKLRTTNIFEDVEAAYDFVVKRGIDSSRIVVYGQSIGSAPAVHLAAVRPVGGLILHSPIASGLQVIDPKPGGCCQPSCFLCCLDVFRNDWRIGRVKCPVLIMHGERDEVVPFRNAEKLRARCKKAAFCTAYFAPNAGHNNFVETNRNAYFKELATFLSSVRGRTPEASEKPVQVSMPQLASALPDSSSGAEFEAPPQKANYGPKIGPDDGRYRKLAQGAPVIDGGGQSGIVAIGRHEAQY